MCLNDNNNCEARPPEARLIRQLVLTNLASKSARPRLNQRPLDLIPFKKTRLTGLLRRFYTLCRHFQLERMRLRLIRVDTMLGPAADVPVSTIRERFTFNLSSSCDANHVALRKLSPRKALQHERRRERLARGRF